MIDEERSGEESFLSILRNIAKFEAEITGRGLFKEDLDESESRFLQIAENIREVFWMSDPMKTRIIYVSPAYENVWGRTCQSLYKDPKSYIDAVFPEDRDRVLESVYRQSLGEQTGVEYRINRPDRTMRWILDRGSQLKMIRETFTE